MDLSNSTMLMSLFLGIGLAAASGFKIFLPLLALSLGAHFGGNLLHLNPDWAWVGSWPALITLAVASVVEIVAYFIPVVDNLLDTLSVPLAAVAGTVLVASTFSGMGPVATWALAIIAGGGTAATISGATAATRALSTGTTGGTGNFLVNTGETTAASVLSLTSLLWAPLAIILVLLVLWVVFKLWIKTRKHFKTPSQ